MTHGRRGACVLVVLTAIILARPLLAADQEEKKDITWTLSGEARFRPEWRDNTDLNDGVDDQSRQGFMRLRLGATILYKDDYRIFVQAQDARVAGEEVNTGSNDKNLDLHQGYLEIKRLAEGLSLVVGRQEWAYGDQRLIGAGWWSNNGRSFDGVKLRYAGRTFWLDGMAARIQTRPGPFGSPPVARTSGSDLFGVYFQSLARKGSEYDGYWLLFDDHVPKAGETGAFGDTAIQAFGGRLKDHYGPFDLNVEGVIERGEQNGDELRAQAAAVVLGYTRGSHPKVRLFGGYDFATGDSDPTDGRQEEFFNFFPTNHALYGYIDYQGWRNLRGPWAAVGVTAGRNYLQVKVHGFQLEQARGAWKDEAGATVFASDPTGSSGKGIGSEVDLTWRFALKEKTSFEVGYANFKPGRFARLNRGEDSSGWAYLMLTATF